MNIIRGKRPSRDFSIFDNALLKDEALNAESLGVLVYLLSKPDDWRVMPGHLAKRFGCGRDKIYRILNDLIAAGYAARLQVRQDDGSFSENNYLISDEKSPLPENPDAAEAFADNPRQLKTDSTKNGIDSVAARAKAVKKGATEYTEQFEELVWKPYPRKNGTSKKDAFRKFARLGTADQDLIISSIPIYAQLKAGKDEEFIQHLETFINKRTFDTVSVSKPALDANPGATEGLTRRQWEQILKVWRMDSNWRLSWGPAPGRPGCRCPDDLLFANELPAARVNTMLTDGVPLCDNPVAGQSHSGSPHQPRSIP